jgi:hypothetical protein
MELRSAGGADAAGTSNDAGVVVRVDNKDPCQAGVFISYELGRGATITRVVKPFSFPLTSFSSASALASRWSGS